MREDCAEDNSYDLFVRRGMKTIAHLPEGELKELKIIDETHALVIYEDGREITVTMNEDN